MPEPGLDVWQARFAQTHAGLDAHGRGLGLAARSGIKVPLGEGADLCGSLDLARTGAKAWVVACTGRAVHQLLHLLAMRHRKVEGQVRMLEGNRRDHRRTVGRPGFTGQSRVERTLRQRNIGGRRQKTVVLIAQHGRRAIFNLKLPMKKRRAEVQANLADFHARCEAAGVAVQTRARQLYHDREEITVLAWTGR